MKIKIKNGDYEVLDTGSVIGIINEPIDFIINEDPEFIIRMLFITDDKLNRAEANAEKYGAIGIKITFINFNQSLGIANPTPMKIGKYFGKDLFLNFRIYYIEGKGHHLLYTWMVREEVANG
jgi:hypothetical protein